MSSVSYNYDIANRLADMDGVPYVYDANGNLLSDGVNTYSYDSANRLTSVLGPSASSQFAYNGLGDRLSQNGVNYTLDLNAGLTQVLDDGTNTYTYGLGRISQTNTSTDYFLGDALGSVRQLTSQSGQITYAKSYDPYGAVTQTSGAGQSAYGYTGESQDAASGMVYLRSRFYNVNDGRFQSRDTWGGEVNRPMSLNRWMYVEGNPANRTEPTGYSSCSSLGTCGPDVTQWYRELMALHYKEGTKTKETLDTLRSILDLYGMNPSGALEADALRRVEFALYGLALDYGRIDFRKSVLTDCVDGNCSILPQNKRTVTLCGHCIDSSDMGNMMFGLGGKVRGFSLGETRIEAYGFNVMTFVKKLTGKVIDFSALNTKDSSGVIPGYRIAEAQAFSSEETFCQIINATRSLGYNDNVDLADIQEPNYRSITEQDLRQQFGPRYSFLYRWSDNESTIKLLFRGGQ